MWWKHQGLVRQGLARHDLLGTIITYFMMQQFGRRTLDLSGMSGMCSWLFDIGGEVRINGSNPAFKRVQSALCTV